MSLKMNKMPTMDWQVGDKLTTWKEYRCWLKVVLEANEVPDKAQYAHMISNSGDEIDLNQRQM